MHYFNLKFPTNRDRNLIRDSSFFYEISSPRHHQALAVPWAKPWWALVEPWAKAKSHQGTTKAWAKANCSAKAWPKGWGLVVQWLSTERGWGWDLVIGAGDCTWREVASHLRTTGTESAET